MRIIIRMRVIYREKGVGARSAKVRNLSAKTKYKFDRRPHAVFDGVSEIVRTYCGCMHALRQSAKVISTKTRHASHNKCKYEVNSLNWQAWRASATLTCPFPTLVLYQVFAGLSRVYGKFMKIFCVFTRFRHIDGVVSRPAPRRSCLHFYK